MPKPVALWESEEKKMADKIANEMLIGVGVADREMSSYGMITLQVRRETTGNERDRVFRSPGGVVIATKHAAG